MKYFYRDFEIRWSDLDANMHLLNSSYMNFMSHVRLAYMESKGFGVAEMQSKGVGPIAFQEHMYYFQEVYYNETIRCTLELSGLSEEGKFFAFEHRFFREDQSNCALGTVVGSWISLSERKLITPPLPVFMALNALCKNENFRILTKVDTRSPGVHPL